MERKIRRLEDLLVAGMEELKETRRESLTGRPDTPLPASSPKRPEDPSTSDLEPSLREYSETSNNLLILERFLGTQSLTDREEEEPEERVPDIPRPEEELQEHETSSSSGATVTAEPIKSSSNRPGAVGEQSTPKTDSSIDRNNGRSQPPQNGPITPAIVPTDSNGGQSTRKAMNFGAEPWNSHAKVKSRSRQSAKVQRTKRNASPLSPPEKKALRKSRKRKPCKQCVTPSSPPRRSKRVRSVQMKTPLIELTRAPMGDNILIKDDIYETASDMAIVTPYQLLAQSSKKVILEYY